jgi:8-oxo-dGTP diphosphatase
MPVEATLCFIKKDGRVLLQKKAKGKFGELLWNGPGGKMNAGETPEDCVKREVFEETGVTVSNLKGHGIVHFYNKGSSAPDFSVHVFSTEDFEGEPDDLGEGELAWFEFSKLPLHEMWDDDKFWLPHVLAGKAVKGHFYFKNKFDKISDYKLEVI